MKKFYLIAAAAAAVLVAGCAKNEVIQYQGPGDAVSFGVYVPKTVTKAGTAGTITVDGAGSTTSLQTEGFGVFATYSNGADYSASIGPNFMYNTKVSTAAWTYSPIKYWPNETINDNNSAIAPSNADKLSFFAYAPWVTAGSGANGITALSANNATTDPMVTYAVATVPSQAVDLLWAVAPASGVSYKDVHNATVTVEAGMPLKNLTKPNTTYKIPFHFRHATSRLGLKIVGAFDQVAAGGTLDDDTKVTVTQVRIVDLPVNTSGELNLNNTVANTPKWENLSGTSTTLVVTGDDLNVTIKDSGSDAVQTVEGVTASEKNVFVNDKTFFTLIPKATSTTVRVEITYYVTTADANLAAGFSRVQNVIYKDITFASGFQAGKSNNIKIILGLTSVKLEATVEDWIDLGDTDVDLPINKDANTFDLASTASVTLTTGNGETDAVWTAANGTVSIDGTIQRNAADFDNSGNVVAVDNANKKITFTGATAGTYVIPVKAAGDATHNPVTKTITVTVTGS